MSIFKRILYKLFPRLNKKHNSPSINMILVEEDEEEKFYYF